MSETTEVIALIILSFFLFLIIGMPIIGIIKERIKKKKQFNALPDDPEEQIPDEVFEIKIGRKAIYLSSHEQKAYDSLSFKQKRSLMAKQTAMINQGKLFVVNHPNGGKGLITRLEAIRTGLIDPKTK